MKKAILYLSAAIIISAQSCKKEKQVHIHCDDLINDVLPAGDPGRVFVWTAFTPNGDGVNDLFKPYVSQISSINVRVYDKNSNLVFQTNQIGTGWNPNPPLSNNETYYFRVEAVTLTNSKIGLCGEVHAIFCNPRNGSIDKFEDQLTPFGFTGVTAESLSNCN